MPSEDHWESLFDVDLIMERLGVSSEFGDVAELGCGHGTFTLATACRVHGRVFAFDIDPVMVQRTAERARHAGLENIVCKERDVVTQGFGLAVGSIVIVKSCGWEVFRRRLWV